MADQKSLNEAHRKGHEEAKHDGPISGIAHEIGNLFVPDSLRSDEAKAREAGYQDELRGKK